MGFDLVALPCLACRGERFEVLLAPAEVEEEREWLREFYSRRIAGDLKDHVDFTQNVPTFVTRCTGCGTVMRNPQPTAWALRRMYQRDEYGEETLCALLDSEREFFRAKARWASSRFSRETTSRPRVLEVGCFVGGFLLAAREAGWEATGVDVGRETTEFCRSMGLDVRLGDLSEVSFEREFDVAFVWNTFDQMNEPGKLLDRLRSLLKPEGFLFIRVPNGTFELICLSLRCGWHRSFAYLAQAYNNFLTFPYLVGYTPSSSTELLAGHGFEVREIAGDTILPLATPDTEGWAVAEERRVKRAVRRAFVECMPWLDIAAQIA